MYKIENFLTKQERDFLIKGVKKSLWSRQDALVVDLSDNVSRVRNDHSVRKTDIYPLPISALPQFRSTLCEYFKGTVEILQMEILSYKKGHFFQKHTDNGYGKDNHNERMAKRKWSMITLLDRSHNLKGGDLILYKTDTEKTKINLKIGESVFFLSKTMHEVTPLKIGSRKVLVTWLGNP